MEEDEGMFQPFWLQNTGSLRRTDSRRPLRRSSSSVFFSSGFYVLALLVIALVFIFFIIPSILSFTSQIFRPNLVKKSWDSLNLVLVLFAIVCGFLSRNTGNENGVSSPSSYDQAHHSTVFNASGEVQKSNPSAPRLWYDQYADRTAYINSSGNTMTNRVRTSSSYPDLRQQETLWNVARDERWRFYDDTHVANYRVSGSDQLHHRRHRSWHEESLHLEEVEAENVEMTKNIPVDTYVIRTEQVVSSETPILTTQFDPQSRSPPPRSPSPPATLPLHKTKRTYQALAGREKSNTDENLEAEKNLKPPPSRPPPSPPSPPLLPPKSKEVESKKSASKNVKERGVGVATTKEFLITSLRRKKKKQRQKSVENFDTLLTSHSVSSSLFPPPSPPPPPPPLPPPPSVFHNFFSAKKSNKPKKNIQSFPQPAPLSPPPLPATITSTAWLSKTKPQTRPMTTTQKPLLPVKVSNFGNVDDENSSGGESPLGPSVRIPPPPPLPPFRIPETKFVVVHGDFVRINSNDSSRSASPDLEYDGDRDSFPSPTAETSSPILGGESPQAAMFCPSPDVNTKAETFIARIRAGMRLEKMNSVQERQGMSRGKSNLGPSY